MTQDNTPVVQADREAAADLWLSRALDRLTAKQIRDGQLDHHDFVQRFARHRLRHQSAAAIGGDAQADATRELHNPIDDAETRAFVDGWNARLDHRDFDMALHHWNLSQVTGVGAAAPAPAPTNEPQSPSDVERMRRALIDAGDQFAFYATEHRRAGKTEKAATNERFSDLCRSAIAAPAPTNRAMGEERAREPLTADQICEIIWLHLTDRLMRPEQAMPAARAIANALAEGGAGR